MKLGEPRLLWIGGKYVLEEVYMRLCGTCARGEYETLHNARFVSLTYHDGSPVMHRR